MNKLLIIPIILIVNIISIPTKAQEDSVSTKKLSAALSVGLLLPDANGFTTSANVMYETKFRYIFGVDIVRYDYINLKQIDYSGFQGSLNNVFFLLGKSWNIKKLILGLDAGVFVGNVTLKLEDKNRVTSGFYTSSNYEAERIAYEPKFVGGIKVQTSVYFSLNEKWAVGTNVVYLGYQLKFSELNKSHANYSVGIGLTYIIK